jgi:hypothetical protein
MTAVIRPAEARRSVSIMIRSSMIESLTGSAKDWITKTSFSRTLSRMRTKVLSLLNLKTSARPRGNPM